MELITEPSVNVGLLIRRPPHEVFEALADPSITTRFWYTKSSGRVVSGAALKWEWGMYGVSSNISVQEVQTDRLIRFTWSGYDPANPTTVELRIIPHMDGIAYLRVTETGFTGNADTKVERALASTAGFTYMICGLKAVVERALELGITGDVHIANLQE